MSLKEILKSDLKDAMRAKEVKKRDSIRAINTMIKQIEVDERKDLNDSDVIKLIQKGIKQRQEAAEQYKDANREDLQIVEEEQIKIFEHYLPKQLSDVELSQKIQGIISKVGASSLKDMGKIMGLASKDLAGVADGKRINEAVKKILA